MSTSTLPRVRVSGWAFGHAVTVEARGDPRPPLLLRATIESPTHPQCAVGRSWESGPINRLDPVRMAVHTPDVVYICEGPPHPDYEAWVRSNGGDPYDWKARDPASP